MANLNYKSIKVNLIKQDNRVYKDVNEKIDERVNLENE